MRKGLLRLVLTATAIAPIVATFPTGSVSAVATTRYVAATGSVGAGTSCASPGYVGTTQSAIQSAINAASNGDTIFICAGTYSISSRLQVTKTLTIRGAGARTTTLDGLESSQILMIHDNNLTPDSGSEITVNVDSIGFINGRAVQSGSLGECEDGNRCGGAIYVESESQINITDSFFKNNYADFVGGAVARLIGNYQNVPSTITNSTFESNTANFDGGGVATLFGFGLTIDSSTFYGNQTLSRSAAAVIANFAEATINNSTFVDNTGPNGTTVLYG
ncbi:MAG: glycosyl hydrolase family 28-related protein, partial [Acidimicrobiaceae bacterium]